MPHVIVASNDATTTATRLCMDFRLRPEVASYMRNHVTDLYAHLLADRDLVSRIAITVHELAENLTKYASTGRCSLEVELEVGADSTRVHVRACNESTPVHLQELCKTLNMINEEPDPIRIYDSIIAQSVLSEANGSGLGLVRIRAEAGMDLSYTVVGSQVTIDARWSGATQC